MDKDEARLYTPDDFAFAFNTEAYLTDFYKDKVEEPAMQLVICLLVRLPHAERALDFGAGPTVHVAMMLRNRADSIYLSDFLPQNREELVNWVRGASNFNWDPVVRMIKTQEGVTFGSESLEAVAKKKVKGVLFCDMHRRPCLPKTPVGEALFDIVTTFFCVEYACLSEEQYAGAIANIVQVVRPGGYFVMGGVLEENWCAFGGRKFACFFLTEEVVLESLRKAGIDTENPKTFSYCTRNDIFLVCGQRRREEKETRS